MQFHRIDEINILNKMIFTLLTTCIICNNYPKCTNNLNKVDDKKPRLLNFIAVKILV